MASEGRRSSTIQHGQSSPNRARPSCRRRLAEAGRHTSPARADRRGLAGGVINTSEPPINGAIQHFSPSVSTFPPPRCCSGRPTTTWLTRRLTESRSNPASTPAPHIFRGRRVRRAGRVGQFAERLTRLVAAATAPPGAEARPSPVPCWRRPGRQRCTGFIATAIDPATGEVVWGCPVCGQQGRIHHGQGSRWDGTARLPRG